MGLIGRLLKKYDALSSEWLTQSFLKLSTTLGGKRVSSQETALRIGTCRACDQVGQLKKEVDFSEIGLPEIGKKVIAYEGCKRCGCPIAVKSMFDTHLAQIVSNNTNSSAIVPYKITCPHPDGDKWAKIKEQLNLQKQNEQQ